MGALRSGDRAYPNALHLERARMGSAERSSQGKASDPPAWWWEYGRTGQRVVLWLPCRRDRTGKSGEGWSDTVALWRSASGRLAVRLSGRYYSLGREPRPIH